MNLKQKIFFAMFLCISTYAFANTQTLINGSRPIRITAHMDINPKLDEYAIYGTNQPDNDIQILKGQTSCKNYQYWNDWYKAMDFKTLLSQGHLSSKGIMVGGYFVPGTTAVCVETDTHLRFNPIGYLAAADLEGNRILADYVNRINKQSFFESPIKVRKPSHILMQYVLEIDGEDTLMYFSYVNHYGEGNKEVVEFDKLVLSQDKTEAIKFFAKKSKNPDEYEDAKQKIAKAKYILFAANSIMLIDGYDFYYGEGFAGLYECPPNGSCARLRF